MTSGGWALLLGLVLIAMALSSTWLQRLPLSTSMLYLALGAMLSPWGMNWLTLEPASSGAVIELLAEIVVLLSLFSSGLKMSLGFTDRRWRLPLRLASISMLVTVLLVAITGSVLLNLQIGAAILLGGILAPTDPVLAAEVQLADAEDRDRLRFSLTGEAGMNDGAAFPFVMLGLGLLGLHDLGTWGWRWLAVDVVWAVTGGVAIGAILGTLVARLVLHLRQAHEEAVGLDNFLSLGLISMSYGLALLAGTYGFLAVFAAGVALRRIERQRRESGVDNPAPMMAGDHADPAISNNELAVDPARAPAFMAHAVLNFNEQLERIGEVAAVIVVGLLLWTVDWAAVDWLFIAILLLVIRPLAAALGLVRSQTSLEQRVLVGWFGIRGIGSLYYLMYAQNQGLSGETLATLTTLTLAVLTVSITVHGISVTPLMSAYSRK